MLLLLLAIIQRFYLFKLLEPGEALEWGNGSLMPQGLRSEWQETEPSDDQQPRYFPTTRIEAFLACKQPLLLNGP